MILYSSLMIMLAFVKLLFRNFLVTSCDAQLAHEIIVELLRKSYAISRSAVQQRRTMGSVMCRNDNFNCRYRKKTIL